MTTRALISLLALVLLTLLLFGDPLGQRLTEWWTQVILTGAMR